MMKKTLAVLAALILVCLVSFPASADGWAFIAEAHHSRDGVHFEQHTFRGSRCAVCGYERSPQTGEFTVDIIGHSCWVMYDCPLYASPSLPYQTGWADTVSNYHVGDYVFLYGAAWVQLKTRADSGAPAVGWVRAENLKIDGTTHIVSGDVTGCVIEITASSGRGRQGPGTEYAYLETVRFRERYVVQGTATGSNGSTWYRIVVDSRPVWISSGLAKLVR